MIETYQCPPSEVHYLGPNDSYSGILAEQIYPRPMSVTLTPQPKFRDIVEAVLKDPSSVGLLPVENSTSSMVHENAEYLFSRQLTILAEARLAINANLIGLEGASIEEAKVVYSHVQALAQCRQYLEAKKLTAVVADSTAAAAEKILKDGDPSAMCLGASKIVERPGLAVVERDVSDYPDNETKFFVVRQRNDDAMPRIADIEGSVARLTMISMLKHRRGSLWKYLAKLDLLGGANLTTIEDRPVAERTNGYRFWIDLETSGWRRHSLINVARKAAQELDILGIYPPPKVYQS